MRTLPTRRLALALGAALLFAACSDFLTEDPRASLTADNLGGDRAGLQSVVLGINEYVYWTSSAFSRNNWLLTDVPTDDMAVRSSRLDRQAMDTYTFGPDNQYIEYVWQRNYQGLARINDVISLAQNAEIEDDAFRAAIEAEGRFWRAFFYHRLVRLFGPVPLITEPYDPSAGAVTFTRAPEAEVFAQIQEDVQYAVDHLPPVRDPDGRGRPAQDAARVLQARVHLTLGEYPEAAAAVRPVIQSGRWSLMEDYFGLFIGRGEGSSESILEIVMGPPAGNSTHYRNEFGVNNANRPTRWGQRTYRNFPMTPQLAALFDDEDLRRESFLHGTFVDQSTGDTLETVDGMPWSSKYIYPDGPPGVNINQNNYVNWQLMRYAEALLILAEAVNEAGGPTEEAYDAINAVRARAGLAPLAGLSQAAFREAVRAERRKELFFEGFRWYDLKRWGILEEAVESAVASNTFDVYPDVDPSKHYRFPIPNTEIQVTGLEQNPGY